MELEMMETEMVVESLAEAPGKLRRLEPERQRQQQHELAPSQLQFQVHGGAWMMTMRCEWGLHLRLELESERRRGR